MPGAVSVFGTRFGSWDHWTSLMVSVHLQHGPAGIEQRVPEERWQEWATQFVSLPEHAGDNLPRPQFFKSWQDWAEAVNHVFWMVGL